MRDAEPSLVEKILAIDAALQNASIQHAFGGALALAFYTREPRATADIDVNVSVPASDARRALAALPPGVSWTDTDIDVIDRDEQVRLWWGRTPVDLFFRASTFHDGVAVRANLLRFAGEDLPFLSANDLAVFKALFNRPKDWLDLAAMAEAGSIDVEWVATTVASIVGQDDRAARVRALRSP